MKKILLSTIMLSSLSTFAAEPFSLTKTKQDQSHRSVFAEDAPAASSDRTSRNAIKLCRPALFAIGNYSFQYEFGFHKNFSAALGIGIFKLPQRIIDKAFPPDPAGQGLKNVNMHGFAITPEIRFYPGKKTEKQAPHGFYLAPYLRYSKTTISADFIADLPTAANPSVTSSQTLAAKISYGGVNGGLMIGKQWIAGKHFAIDWWILGGGYGKAKLKAEFNSTALAFTPEQKAELQAQLDDQMSSVAVPGVDGTATVTNNGAKLDVSGLKMFSVRVMGISLGYAF